jgi:cell division protein FtsW (lipid II flippase)
MTTSAIGTHSSQRLNYALAVVLLLLGLSGHLVAAAAIAGRYTTTFIAYRDHIGGFCLATLVSLLIVGLLGRRFWRGRFDRTLLIVGVLQLLFGIFVYIERFAIVGVH